MSKGNYIFVWIHSIFHMSIYEFKRFGDQLNFSFCFWGGGGNREGGGVPVRSMFAYP